MNPKLSIEHFHTQAMRDLIWVISSPSMMHHPLAVTPTWGLQELAQNPGLVARLSKNNSPLVALMRKYQSKRVGDYFERLVLLWFKEQPHTKVILSNHQVQSQNGTLGEFDLVFQRDNVTWHWELAVKFYLGYVDQSGRTTWYGPNSKDTLAKKWQKMTQRQLKLSQHPDAQKALRFAHVHQDVVPRAFIKGYLFKPLAGAQPDRQLPAAMYPGTNPNVLRGWWVHRSQLVKSRSEIEQGKKLLWIRLSRLRWLSPAIVTKHDVPKSFAEIADSLPDNSSSLIVGMAQGPEGCCEVTRGFVVPDHWPRQE